MTEIHDKNASLLRERFPGLIERIEREAAAGSDEYPLELASGSRGEASLLAAGRWVHSQVAPRREAERMAAGSSGGGPLVVLGFGLGYAAEAAAAAYPGRPLIVAEKDPRVLRLAFSSRDLSALLSRGGLAFLVSGDPADLPAALDRIGSIGGEPAILANRTLRDLNRAWYDEAEAAVRSWAARDEINAATLKRFGARWVRNLARNLETVRDVPGVARLEGRFAGFPALLMAAGPSLDEILPHLPEIAERCLVVAVDTSLRAALGAGVDPDFAVVVDPQYWNARHLDRCPAPRTALVAESAVYPSVFSSPFERSFLCASLFPLGRFVEAGVDPKGGLGAGGSVATSAWDFVRVLGCGPIWAAGLDLSYPGLKTHFKGALFEERTHAEARRTDTGELRSFRALRDGRPFPAPAADGGAVLTDKRLSLYASWFESRFRRYPEAAPRSLSPKGLRIGGLRGDALERLLSLPVRRGEIDDRLGAAYGEIDRDWNAGAAERTEAFGRRVAELTAGLEALAGIAEKAAETAREAQGAKEATEKSAALDALDEANRLIATSAVKDVAGFLFPRIGDLEAELPPGEADPLGRHLRLSRLLYERLAKTAGFNAGLLKKKL